MHRLAGWEYDEHAFARPLHARTGIALMPLLPTGECRVCGTKWHLELLEPSLGRLHVLEEGAARDGYLYACGGGRFADVACFAFPMPLHEGEAPPQRGSNLLVTEFPFPSAKRVRFIAAQTCWSQSSRATVHPTLTLTSPSPPPPPPPSPSPLTSHFSPLTSHLSPLTLTLSPRP